MTDAPSHRWKTTPAVDVDAFLLMDRRWLLFAYVKDGKLIGDAEFFKRLAREFSRGDVVAVARALKTDKGSEPLSAIALSGDRVPLELWGREGWLRYRLETEKVLNPGLFLDQAGNRHRLIELVQHHVARTKGVFGENDGLLNLFSYTGSFSIAGVCGGAKATTSVDVSARYLEWEKQNFEANFGGMDVVSHRLICDDARDFLRRSVKRETRYRWIILDPPTFSRGKGKPFKIQDELITMLEDAVQCLAPGGAILASGNDARWETAKFYAELEKFGKASRLLLEKGQRGPGFDPAHPLKSAWLFSAG